MNDRLTELYAKACLDARDIHPTDVPAFMACMAGNLAKLIVQECAHVAVFKNSGTVATAAVAGHMAAGRSIAAKLIKEHFGVEE